MIFEKNEQVVERYDEVGIQLLDQFGILDSLPSDQLRMSVKEMVEGLILATDLAYPPENNPQDEVAVYNLAKPTKSYAIHSL